MLFRSEMNVLIGILIPLLGTSLGAAGVYAMKKEMNKKINKILLGFASGVMMAASVWSLIIPAIEAFFRSSSGWSNVWNSIFIFFR
mgnify:CR=1 FL=1